MIDGVECPKCGRHTIVQRHQDVFLCLNCDFQRDFSRSTQFRDTKTSSSSKSQTKHSSYGYSSIGSSRDGYSRTESKDQQENGFLPILLFIILFLAFGV